MSLDEQVYYTEKDGHLSVPSDPQHAFVRQFLRQTMEKAYRSEGSSIKYGWQNQIPLDNKFHDIGFMFFGLPILFKKDPSVYKPIFRGAPTHFKLTGNNLTRNFQNILGTIQEAQELGLKLTKWPSIVYHQDPKEAGKYYLLVTRKIREAKESPTDKEEKKNLSQKVRGLLRRR